MKKILIILFIITFLVPVAVFAGDNNQQNDQSSISARGEGYNPQYNILPIIIGMSIAYLFTLLLYDIKSIKKRNFKQIWSIILMSTFLFSGISGIIMALLSDYKLQFPLNFNLLFWHVEFSVTMAVTLIFHIHIYRKAILKVLRAFF